MNSRIKGLLCLTIISFILFLFTCAELPVNPATDPDNVTATITIPDGSSGIIQGKPITIQIVVRYPNLTKLVQLSISNVLDTTLYCDVSTTFDTLLAIRTFKDTGRVVIKADVELNNGTFKPFYDTISILAKPLTVTFDSVPQAHYVATDEPDTLIFVASTDPAGGNITCTTVITPAIVTDTVKTLAQGNKTFVIFTPSQKGVYTLNCIAQSGTARDTASIQLTAYNKPVFIDESKTNVITSGTTDTLIFTVTADTGDTATLKLLNAAVLGSDIVKVLTSGADSLIIVFTPKEAKNYTFLILSSDKYGTDTISVTKTVTAETTPVWKQTAVALSAVEGTGIEHSLAAYLNDTTIKADSLTVTRGVIINKVWKYTVPFGSAASDSVIVKATKNGAVSECKISLTVTPGDTTKPVITQKTPATENFTTSASTLTCSFVITDTGAGVGAVIFKIGSTVLTDTTHSDSVWQCTLKNLTANQMVKLMVIATDRSMTKNTDSLSVNITCDPTAADNTPPVIAMTSGPKSGERITTATGSIVVNIADQSGIKDVSVALNGTSLTGISKSGNDYTIPLTISSFGTNKIVITATDSATAQNRDSLTVTYIYNTLLQSTLNFFSPMNNASELPQLPTFKWQALTDADGDTVYYKVLYSTISTFTTASASKSLEVTGVDSLTLDTARTLSSNTKYYWRVIGYTKSTIPADTAWSDINNFTTVNLPPVITLTSPVKGVTKIDPSTGKLQFNATDAENGALKYSILVGTSKTDLFSTSMRVDNNAAVVCNFADLPGAPLANATKYYWTAIAIDNGLLNKSDTAAIDSFYTVNRVPVWTVIPSKDSTYYRCAITLGAYCSDPDNNGLTYQILTGTNATVSGDTLNCVSDSALITVQAIDNFAAQPCTSSTTFRRWFITPALMKFISSKGDTITIGNDGGQYGNERPEHLVTFTKNIFCDSTEVTQLDYSSIMKTNPSLTTIYGVLTPVENVTWFDAVLYCNARSKRDGLDTVYTYSSITGTAGNGCSDLGNLAIDYTKTGYRLPTESEWEYLCIAKGPAYLAADQFAWHNDNSNGTTHVVASKTPNNWKLYDMLGNVNEYCNDWYATYSSGPQTDPTGPATQTTTSGRIVRGSGFNGDPMEEVYAKCRSVWAQLSNTGFRVVRLVP